MKRLKVYNYYNGVYEELNYRYDNGYIEYSASALGMLVFAQKDLSFLWVYILVFGVMFSFGCTYVVKKFKNREKINKYKSLKRRKDNEYC